MTRFDFPLATALFLATACHAEGVFKCTAPESGVSFQATPCAEGAVMVLALAPSARAPGRPAEDATAETPDSTAPFARVAIHSSRDQLHAGMSDLQVLNNRRWGKPQRITRNRDARAWHEYWAYQTGANGGRQLHFVNGMLAGIEDLVRPAPPVSMASAAIIEGEGR